MSIHHSGTLDLSTRPNRRQAVALIIMWLCRVSSAEESYLNRIPNNLRSSNAYAASEDSITLLTEAITALLDAY